MECREVRGLAEAYVSEQLATETARAVAAHVDRCPVCRNEVEGLQRLRASVHRAWFASRDLAPTPDFSANLRARLQAEVPARPGWWHQRSLMALAATLVLVLGGAFGIRALGVLGFDGLLEAAVGDHQFCIVRHKMAERPLGPERILLNDDPFDRSLRSVQPSPSELSGGAIRIIERHSCTFGGRRFVHMILRYKGVLSSVTITPDDRLFRGMPGVMPPRDGSIATLQPVDGLRVVAFRGGAHHVVFIISPLQTDDVRQLARTMLAPLTRVLRQQI